MYFTTLILKNLTRRKVRTTLTCLGVALAVGTMVSLRGIADGFERSTAVSFEERGVDLVIVEDGVPDQLSSNLDERIGEKIAAIPGVVAYWPGLLEIVAIPKGRTMLSVLVQGMPAGCYAYSNLAIEAGRAIEPSDRHAAMIGSKLSTMLGKGVGDTIEFQEQSWKIVGVYRTLNIFEDSAITVDLHELQPVMARPGRVTGFSLVIDPAGPPVEAVRDQVLSLRDEKGKPYRLSVLPTREYITGSMHLKMAHAMAWITSAVAVLIGSVSMLNTMFMQVMERTREIGILRAIGWRRSRVVRMVLGESLVLAIAGAAVGMLVAIALTRGLTQVPLVSGYIAGDIALRIFAEGTLMAVLVGLLGGAYPAMRAAQLAPTEAIRHE